ncbi:MAG: 2-C-methyl-D-erythritol 2,4-cyclodiphosphate synthase [Candidatus Fluviicola riflensis]|nr:MAG: 2-C-methyl-D-erythritol 2,4-cyclodiphosphate synthase [Candidatus Fluviicola riflensis]OGS76265.1 MAG: 2-C-methyl-D-erythritol 2,4-cyclodiphosphate synthase [Candidatus Fluviicola riflensis]OGS83191.1 MAG: 2-C-methyl-D-erythritol 2,4-cyclodiphosphate synthase [Fluviicola sp. RIFCSPHIGHO2_01_FULL_43_53]OGS83797.1 MAG: 2-C-methyl-D-erythritol 2,4-cyclodiphosphate synthase [Fluviicola sp. RIFCSPHIGHO2_12_FULL_43_24]
MDIRIGFGVDVHRLEEGRQFVVGGVVLPSSFGAVGHSDADVLLHTICDGLLGALNLRDIGYHFSDTDPQYKGIDSTILLENVMKLVTEKGYQVSNIDCTVILEKPKVNPHIPEMQAIIARLLQVDDDRISIKATTHEKVDSFGEGKAVKAYAVCLLMKP